MMSYEGQEGTNLLTFSFLMAAQTYIRTESLK